MRTSGLPGPPGEGLRRPPAAVVAGRAEQRTHLFGDRDRPLHRGGLCSAPRPGSQNITSASELVAELAHRAGPSLSPRRGGRPRLACLRVSPPPGRTAARPPTPKSVRAQTFDIEHAEQVGRGHRRVRAGAGAGSRDGPPRSACRPAEAISARATPSGSTSRSHRRARRRTAGSPGARISRSARTPTPSTRISRLATALVAQRGQVPGAGRTAPH